MKLALAALAVLSLCLATCSRETGEPDPPTQVLVPCDPSATADDPSACPPDAARDAGIDSVAP